MDRRDIILTTISDLVSDFLNDDRKEDEDLPRGAIEDAISDEEITVDEIVAEFSKQLTEGLS